MAQSFQKEKPPARINLFLEVQKGDAKEKLELPQRMLMMGDFKGREDPTPLEDREVINVDKDNFESVMKSMDLKVAMTVPDMLKGGGQEMPVALAIDGMSSVRPEEIAKQVAPLNRLVARRNLLQDLRNRVVSVSQFRKELDAIVKDPAALEKLTQELDQIVPREEANETPDAQA